MSPSCATGSSRVGLLAAALHPAAFSKLNTGVAGGGLAGGIRELDRTLQSNGVSALLNSMPTVRGSGQIAVLAGLVATIFQTLHVNLLAPNAASLLTTALQRACFRFLSAQGSLPRVPAALLPALTHLGGAAVALRPIGVDLFSPSAAKQLQSVLSNSATRETLVALAHQPMTLAMTNRLSNVGSLALGGHSLSQLIAQMTIAPGALGLASTLGTLQSESLTSLWHGISTGVVSPQIKLPGATQVAELNAQKTTLQLLHKSAGLDPRSPTFSKDLQGLVARFQGSGVCRVIQAHPMTAAQLEGLERFASLQSSLGAAQQGLNINLLEKAAGAKLSRQVGHLKSASQPPPTGSMDWADVIGALTRLAQFGTAVT